MTEQQKNELADLIENYEGTIKDGVQQIIDFFKQASYVKLAEDQSLPDIGIPKEAIFYFNMARQDMLKVGWRKVEL